MNRRCEFCWCLVFDMDDKTPLVNAPWENTRKHDMVINMSNYGENCENVNDESIS